MLGRFAAIRPSGKLHNLRFRLVHRPELPPHWTVSAHVEDSSLDAHGHFPGVRGLPPNWPRPSAGRLVFSSDDLGLDLPHLFPHPLRFDTVTGEVRWHRETGSNLRIDSPDLVANNADMATRSRFSIRLPMDGGSLFLNLHTELRDLTFAKVPHYLPSKILKERLTSWLEHAFVGGGIPQGALLFRGAIADFLFDDRQGRFQALLAVRDGTLDFHRGWPPFTALVSEVRSSPSERRLLDSDLVKGSARIPDLSRAVAVEIQGQA